MFHASLVSRIWSLDASLVQVVCRPRHKAQIQPKIVVPGLGNPAPCVQVTRMNDKMKGGGIGRLCGQWPCNCGIPTEHGGR